MDGLFGSIFDFNHDGATGPEEWAVGLGLVASIDDDASKEKKDSSSLESSAGCIPGTSSQGTLMNDTGTQFDPFTDDVTEIEDWGIMDEFDRSNALEAAGLGPDDYRLEMADIDRNELAYMDEGEATELLEDAGFDPEDYL